MSLERGPVEELVGDAFDVVVDAVSPFVRDHFLFAGHLRLA
jgi:hypothetical protein